MAENISLNTEKETYDKILNIILKYCGEAEDRMKSLGDGRVSPCIEIEFIFMEKENKTYITFLYGNRHKKTSTSDDFEIDGIISDNIVIGLINKLLLDHETVRYFSVGDLEIIFNLGINYNENSLKGINCDDIGIVFDFYHYPNREKLMEHYLNMFALNYLDKLKNTPYFSEMIERYFKSNKKQFVDSLNYNELRKFICLMDDDELKSIIENMDNNRFKKLQEKYEESSKILKLK